MTECDHGKLKRIINATLDFKSMKTAYATKGTEDMRPCAKDRLNHFTLAIPRNAAGKQHF